VFAVNGIFGFEYCDLSNCTQTIGTSNLFSPNTINLTESNQRQKSDRYSFEGTTKNYVFIFVFSRATKNEKSYENFSRNEN
jgi:hypothetical protein